jgi:hypothetical protein
MRRLARGKYAAKARRSFAVALVEPEIFAQFGSSEAINAALKALLEAADAMKPRRGTSSTRHRSRPGPTVRRRRTKPRAADSPQAACATAGPGQPAAGQAKAGSAPSA